MPASANWDITPVAPVAVWSKSAGNLLVLSRKSENEPGDKGTHQFDGLSPPKLLDFKAFWEDHSVADKSSVTFLGGEI